MNRQEADEERICTQEREDGYSRACGYGGVPCSGCRALIDAEEAAIERYLAAGETVIVSALRPVRADEDSEPRSRGRVAIRRRVSV